MAIRFDLNKDKEDIQLLEKCECISMFMQLNGVIDMLDLVYEFVDMADKTNRDIPSHVLTGLAMLLRGQIDLIFRLLLLFYPKNDKYGSEEMKQEAKLYYS